MATYADPKLGIVKLNNNNYQMWKFNAEMLLLKDDLWNTIVENKPEPVTGVWKRKDDAARATIALSIEPTLHHLINKCTSSREMWIKIKTQFERIGFSSKIFLKKKLYNTRLEGNEMDKYINDITNLVDKLRCGGSSYDESEVVSTLLCGLPESYDSLIMGLEAREENSLTLEEVKIKLLDESERKRENITYEQKVLASIKEEGRNHQSSKSNITCFNCQKTGHYQSNCTQPRTRSTKRFTPQSPRNDYYQNQTSNWNNGRPTHYEQSYSTQDIKNREEEISEYLSFLTGLQGNTLNDQTDLEWILDSGATSHMCWNEQLLTEFQEFSSTKSVQFANGTRSIATGNGNITITQNDTEITLKSVVLVPEMKLNNLNLMSVSKLCEDGYTIVFENENCEIKRDNLVIMEGKIQQGIYTLKCKSNEPNQTHTINTCVHDWHRRLGHRSINTINKMAQNKDVYNLKITPCDHDDFCKISQICTLKQHPFKTVNLRQSNKPFQLIHMDLCGPIQPTTKGGGNYILVLTDDFSRYSFLSILERKSDANNMIIKYINHFQNKFGYLPENFRSDNGGEFENQELNNYFHSKGIHHQLSVRYTPQQNGVAERVNQTLIRMTKSIMMDKNLDKELWGEAASAACHLYNRTSHSHTGTTPYSLWEGRKPDLGHLRIIGSNTYSYVPAQQRKKLDPNSRTGILIGYSPRHKGYRILDDQSNKMSVETNVNIQEQEDKTDKTPSNNEYYIESRVSLPKFEELPTEGNTETPRRSERENLGTIPLRYRQ